MKLRLHHRYSLIIVTLLLSVAAMMAGGAILLFGTLSQRAQTASAEAMSKLLVSHAVQDGRSLAVLASETLANPLYRFDMQAVGDAARAIRTHDGVLAVHVLDPFGRTLHDGRDKIGDFGQRSWDPTVRQALQMQTLQTRIDGDMLHVIAPVQAGSRLLGAVHLEMSLASLAGSIAEAGSEIARIAQDSRAQLITVIGSSAVLIGIVGLLVGVLVGRSLSLPIKALSAMTRRIGQGDYDVSVSWERNDELGDLAQDLRTMAADLKQAAHMSRLATVGEMAVGVAHELNQPLNTIRMASDNALHALDGGLSDVPYLQDKLGLISTLAGRMGEQIQRMCAVGRRDERQLPFDPVVSVRDALALQTGQLEMDGIALAREIPEASAEVLGSRQLLTQAILNLLSNARDAILEQADRPVGRVRSVQGRIRVAVEVDHLLRENRIVVADNGGGVPNEIRERIFDPFFTTKQVNEGTGLGLSISYGIVSAMGGRIEVRNEGEGAVFVIVLPLAGQETKSAVE